MKKSLPDPSEEQIAIMLSVQDNPTTIVEAGPGCAKSTTIRLSIASNPIANRTSTYVFAFNKDIVAELKSLVPAGVTVTTLNSFGLGLWRKHIGRMPTLNTKKTREIIKSIADSDNRWSIVPEEYDPLMNLVKFAKSQGYTPPGAPKVPGAPDFDTLCSLADVRPEKHYEKLLGIILNLTITKAFDGELDFDDQVYIPSLLAPTEVFPKVSFHYVDEAQDLSPIQLRLVGRCKAERLCIVGDPLQAIYAFRGAMSDAFDQIHSTWPNAVTLPLQTTYRIPQKVLKELQGHNPALVSAKPLEGTVESPSDTRTMSEWIGFYLPHPEASVAMLCRNNAPLYRAALACIADQTPFNIRDNGWGFAILRDLKKVCGKRMRVEDIPEALASFWLFEFMKPAQEAAVMDKITTLIACSDGLENSGELYDRLEGLLNKVNESQAAKPLHLATAHKAKGMEYDLVFHLDPQLIPSPNAKTVDDLQQEANIQYVLNSRTRDTLVFLVSPQILIPSTPAARSRPSIKERQRL